MAGERVPSKATTRTCRAQGQPGAPEGRGRPILLSRPHVPHSSQWRRRTSVPRGRGGPQPPPLHFPESCHRARGQAAAPPRTVQLARAVPLSPSPQSHRDLHPRAPQDTTQTNHEWTGCFLQAFWLPPAPALITSTPMRFMGTAQAPVQEQPKSAQAEREWGGQAGGCGSIPVHLPISSPANASHLRPDPRTKAHPWLHL